MIQGVYKKTYGNKTNEIKAKMKKYISILPFFLLLVFSFPL